MLGLARHGHEPRTRGSAKNDCSDFGSAAPPRVQGQYTQPAGAALVPLLASTATQGCVSATEAAGGTGNEDDRAVAAQPNALFTMQNRRNALAAQLLR
jgi:hypothetical protein